MAILQSVLTERSLEHGPAQHVPGRQRDREKKDCDDAQIPHDGLGPTRGATLWAEPRPLRVGRSRRSPHPHCSGCPGGCRGRRLQNREWRQLLGRTAAVDLGHCEMHGQWIVAVHLVKSRYLGAPSSSPECAPHERNAQHFRCQGPPSRSLCEVYKMIPPRAADLPIAAHPHAAALSYHGLPGVAFRKWRSELATGPQRRAAHAVPPAEAAHRES
mmetsp:Transcript_47125/g.102527  ORF Transcript_47125/g.102527 Transcript_47125/m.102527 type:complete len:215 (+) Transcript_47125:135-779(+)